MFSKVLIANRGEIAVRIIKTCRRLGVRTVAIYSDADREALHTKLADQAFRVGEPPPLQSYLSIERICEAVMKSGADAVHPGYGFLSEFHQFAEAVVRTGAAWVGPRPDVMTRIESKTYARTIARENGIPTIPGGYEPMKNPREITTLIEKYGPLLIKPDAGGGGKGTRKISDPAQADELMVAASREALMYFGKGDLYAEKMLERPRHVEVQILGDDSGKVIHLFERECSLQRRFQKVVEEAPSTALTDLQRKELAETAVRLAGAIGYTNAGTFEFLYEEAKPPYFLEINKRLQVEHPVTEMTTGIDIVEQQLRIASGQALSIGQEDVRRRGHSIEARVYAEDPKTFMPSPGVVTSLRLPEGTGVRVDHALEVGTSIPFYYDPLIAKVATWGEDRDEAIAAMAKSLAAFEVAGVKTSLPFHKALVRREDFLKNRLDTTYLERVLPQIREELGRAPS